MKIWRPWSFKASKLRIPWAKRRGGADRRGVHGLAQVTGKPEDGGLGFDFKWNMGWMNDFTSYMRCDPYFRKYNYGELTFSMLYAYSEILYWCSP